MIFVAHFDYFDEINVLDKTEKALILADTFSKAVKYLEQEFGEQLENLSLLEPIAESSHIIYIDDKAEEVIKKHPHNSFF